MIIGTEFLDRHVPAVLCTEGTVETTLGTFRILEHNKANLKATKVESSTPKQHVNKTKDPDKSAIIRSAI